MGVNLPYGGQIMELHRADCMIKENHRRQMEKWYQEQLALYEKVCREERDKNKTEG